MTSHRFLSAFLVLILGFAQTVSAQSNPPQDRENIKEKYEDHHHVTYTKEALEACVKLSDRYISDRFMPDKAIDLMDEATSRLALVIVVSFCISQERKRYFPFVI